MAVQKQDGLHTDVKESATDLRGDEFKFCAVDNTTDEVDLCGDDGQIAGVISEGRDVGYHTSFNLRGNPILKVIVGEAISRGDDVASMAGGLAKTGSTNSFGVARNNAAIGEYVEINTLKTT